MEAMELLDKYSELQDQIYEYFGFKEDWTVYPIDDARKYYWYINGDAVTFADSEQELREVGEHYYSNEILHHRLYPKAIYEGKDFTMIMVDTRTDGNKFLQIFDNSKKVEGIE